MCQGMVSVHYIRDVPIKGPKGVRIRTVIFLKVMVHKDDIKEGYVKCSVDHPHENALILRLPLLMAPLRKREAYELMQASLQAEAENKEEEEVISRFSQLATSDMEDVVEQKKFYQDYVLRLQHTFDLAEMEVHDCDSAMLEPLTFDFGEFVWVKWRIITTERPKMLKMSAQPKKKLTAAEVYGQKHLARDGDDDGDADMRPDQNRSFG